MFFVLVRLESGESGQMNVIVRCPGRCRDRAVGDSVEGEAGVTVEAMGMANAVVADRPGRATEPTDHQLVSAVRARRRPRVRGALLALPAPDRRATSTAWSRTTAAPRTSRRRCSSPRCAACARPSGRSPSSRGSTRSPRTRASTPTGAAAAPRRSPTTPTTGCRPPTTCGSSRPARSPTPRSTPSRTSTTCAARSAGSRRATTRSSSCASSRGSATRTSASAWA